MSTSRNSTAYTFTKQTGMAAIAQLLLHDRAFLIRSVVENNPGAARANYRALYDQSLSAEQLINVLVKKANNGKWNEVLAVINVPFHAGANDELDQAFTYLRGEAQVRVADPATRASLKNLPTTGMFEDPADTADTLAGPTDDPSVWDQLLDTLPGVIGVINDIAGSSTTTTDTAEAERVKAEREKAKRRTTLIILGITIVLITAFVVILKKASN